MLRLFTCRDDVTDVEKAVDPAWMFHNPVYGGDDFVDCLPPTRKDGGIYFFEKPESIGLNPLQHLFDGMILYETQDKEKEIIYCFAIKPSDETKKQWTKVENEYKAKGIAVKQSAARVQNI